MWEPQRLTTLWASSFLHFFFFTILPPSHVDVNYACRFASAFLYVSMASCLIKNGHRFTLLLVLNSVIFVLVGWPAAFSRANIYCTPVRAHKPETRRRENDRISMSCLILKIFSIAHRVIYAYNWCLHLCNAFPRPDFFFSSGLRYVRGCIQARPVPGRRPGACLKDVDVKYKALVGCLTSDGWDRSAGFLN
jgi:hypothetical protein